MTEKLFTGMLRLNKTIYHNDVKFQSVIKPCINFGDTLVD